MIIGVPTYLVHYLLCLGAGGRSDVISNTAFCAIAGGAPYLAIQLGMGVLSKQWLGFGLIGCVGVVFVGPPLERFPKRSGSKSSNLEPL